MNQIACELSEFRILMLRFRLNVYIERPQFEPKLTA